MFLKHTLPFVTFILCLPITTQVVTFIMREKLALNKTLANSYVKYREKKSGGHSTSSTR